MMLRALIAVLVLGMVGWVHAQDADPAGTIVLRAGDKKGITLVGKAKITKPPGTPEQVKEAGFEGESVISLGVWSKPMPDECRAEFAPTIPADGFYEIYLRWNTGPVLSGVGPDLPVRIEYLDQRRRTLNVTPRLGNVWAFIGTYPLKADGSTRIIADAQGTFGASNLAGVKLIRVAAPLAKLPRVLPHKSDTADAFEKLRNQLALDSTPTADADLSNPLLADKVLQQDFENYLAWKTMRRSGGDLWREPQIRDNQGKNESGGWPLTAQYLRLRKLAEAYVGSNAQLGFAEKMQGNPQLLKDILYGLEEFYKTRFNEKTVNKAGADWIGNEITNPMHIAATINLIHPHVDKAFIARQSATFDHMSKTPLRMYQNVGATTGFNRMYACLAWAQRGLMEADAKKMELARDAISDEFAINRRSKPIVRENNKPTLDGFYDDGSFIQHSAFPYIGIYGNGVISQYAALARLLANSPWEINDPASQVFYRWVLEGYMPLYHRGVLMYGSLGRSTGQSWHQNGTIATRNLNDIVSLVPGAPPQLKSKIAGFIKAQLIGMEQSPFPQFNRLAMREVDLSSSALFSQIKNDPSIQPLHPRPGTHVFYNTDYLVHHQPDFAAQLRMFSTRIKTHEDINEGTNRFGWYQGEGTLFLYDRDDSRYNDHYFATVDPYRLPGITVDPRPREQEGSRDGQFSKSPWAGGVSLDSVGVASMGLAAVEVSLTGKKAWFFLDDQIVCLGTDITSTDNRPIETIVENAKLIADAKNAFTVNGGAQPTDLDWSAELAKTRWAHLVGNTAGSDVGYVFPQTATIKASRLARSGSWKASFRNDKDAETHTRNYLLMKFDHGQNPKAADYAYILLPGRSAEQTAAYADKPGAQILSNTPKLQAVRYNNTIAASVWTDEPTPIGDITVTGACNLIITDAGIAVSDPTQLRKEPIRLVFNATASKPGTLDPGVKVESITPLTITIDPTDSDGKPYRATVGK